MSTLMGLFVFAVVIGVWLKRSSEPYKTTTSWKDKDGNRHSQTRYKNWRR